MSRLIIVSNRLPVSIHKKDGRYQVKPSSGGLATGLGSVFAGTDNLWIGWPGESFRSREDRDEVTEILGQERMIPVFLGEELMQSFYTGFSNNTLWPLFHYFPSLTTISEDTWKAYKRANALFAEVVLSNAKEGDTVWVHDYHLFLLPALLREKLPGIRIGFFLHIPFPSYEIFRILPGRKELLNGVLGADLIGFHTYDDMRHFLSAASRLLGLSNTNGRIQSDGHTIKVDSFPMGIDYDKYARLAGSKIVARKITDLRKRLGEMRLIVSVDRLDLSKGIPEKLKAFEYFLDRHPDFLEKCTLILLVVPSRTDVPAYQDLKREIEQEVGRINGKFGRIDWTPILYLFRGVTNETLSAFYRMSEIALITPLRDGMNLVAKEYVATRQDQNGVLILSEFAGASKELNDALIVNPYDTGEVSEAINDAFAMPLEERRARSERMQHRLRRYNVRFWAETFLRSLEDFLDSKDKTLTRALGNEERKQLMKAFGKSSKRLLFLDYDGTLAPFTPKPADASPDEELLSILTELASDPANRVVVISGRDRFTLEKWLGKTGVDLIAEHGVWLKRKGAGWIRNETADNSWKDDFRHIFEEFTDRTPGTLTEEKDYSIVWHYRQADPDFAVMRSRELLTMLSYLTANRNLNVMEGNKIIELKHAAVHKGIAAANWLREDQYDFILTAGDDRTDEDLFSAMPSNAWKIKIGDDQNTNADYSLPSYIQMRKLLKKMEN
jgi:trehalose 6-phosphate synthase/phosphatase